MFSNFTEKSREALRLAHDAACRMGHRYVGSEHLLMGLINEGSGVAWRTLSDAGITADLVEKKVFRNDTYIHLGPTEFRLLKMLLETPGKVFSRDFLLKNVWGDNIYVESRTVDVHIRRLRRALNDFGPDYIRTVRATGYAIDANPSGDE